MSNLSVPRSAIEALCANLEILASLGILLEESNVPTGKGAALLRGLEEYQKRLEAMAAAEVVPAAAIAEAIEAHGAIRQAFEAVSVHLRAEVAELLASVFEQFAIGLLTMAEPLSTMCSHPGAGGPCLPRVRDGRCIWCERELHLLRPDFIPPAVGGAGA